jgi:HlyD family secretion protein
VVFRGAPRRVLLAPANTIRRQGQVSSVFVVRDGAAHLRLVHTGLASPDGVEVLAGLQEAESIVVDPPPQLRDGSLVVTSAGAAVPTGAAR